MPPAGNKDDELNYAGDDDAANNDASMPFSMALFNEGPDDARRHRRLHL
jgi:hypothetical protein